jgi:hypothetical protein
VLIEAGAQARLGKVGGTLVFTVGRLDDLPALFQGLAS